MVTMQSIDEGLHKDLIDTYFTVFIFVLHFDFHKEIQICCEEISALKRQHVAITNLPQVAFASMKQPQTIICVEYESSL